MGPVADPSAKPRRPRARMLAAGLARVLGAACGLALLGAVALWLTAGTRALNQRLDSYALSMMGRDAARGPRAAGPARLPFHDARELEALTRWTGPPLAPTTRPLAKFRLDRPDLIQEIISFPSAIPVAHVESNTATAYVWRHGRLGDRPIILWVAGLYVSDLAMVPIGWFTRLALDDGVDVVFFEPPYHLGRTPVGLQSGEAFFTTTLGDHLTAFAQELSDLRRLAAWLRGLGAPAVGGFGGSLGALALLRLSTWDDTLDFLTVFIPVVRPTDLLQRPETEAMRARLVAEGGSLAAMLGVYGAFDLVTTGPSRLDPARISVLYGRFDLVARPDTIAAWARAWGVTRLYPFDRGHSLALFAPTARADYARALHEDLGVARATTR